MFSPNSSPNAIVNNQNNLTDVSGYYANLSLTHRINRWLNQSLSAGRQFQLGVTANLVNLYYASYQADWGFIRNFGLTTQLIYEHGLTFDGTQQTLNVYGGNIGLGYTITQKLRSSINYGLQLKKANPSTLNYVQNRLVFDFEYSF